MKTWHQMSGTEAMRSCADYAAYNYGHDSTVAKACKSGTRDEFMAATKFVTYNSDMKLASVQDKFICEVRS